MLGRAAFALSAIVLGLGISPAVAQEKSDHLAPSSPWNVDFGDTKCRLARFFGEGDDRHLLFMEQWGPSGGFGLTVAGDGFKHFRSRRDTKVHFFESQPPYDREPFKGDVEGFGKALIFPGLRLKSKAGSDRDENFEATALPQLDPDFADRVDFMEFRQGNRKVRLLTGPLSQTFKVMNKCTQNMVRTWGLDVEKHLTATRLPKLIGRSDVVRRIQAKYPRSALKQGEQGIFRMRVMVDETGNVTECIINNATIQDRLESPACSEMRLAEFEPAIDKDGKAFKSYYTTSITYRAN